MSTAFVTQSLPPATGNLRTKGGTGTHDKVVMWDQPVSSLADPSPQMYIFLGAQNKRRSSAHIQPWHDVSDFLTALCVRTIYEVSQWIQPASNKESKLRQKLHSYANLEDNWDGEGAAAPIVDCIKNAVSFIRLLPDNIPLPEPMIHASGHTGLFWGDGGIYADIEFLHNGRIAYYIEQNGDKHKGAINFDSEKLPPVFSVLLES